MTFFRTPYNYDRDAASVESGISFDQAENQTQQHFAEECDINTIVRRFGVTHELPASFRAPAYGDFTGVDDYQSALNAVMEADRAFMSLPGELRARFENKPQALLEFLADPANRKEAEELGLVKPPAEVDRAGGTLPLVPPVPAPGGAS